MYAHGIHLSFQRLVLLSTYLFSGLRALSSIILIVWQLYAWSVHCSDFQECSQFSYLCYALERPEDISADIFSIFKNSTQSCPFWGSLAVDINSHLSSTFFKACGLTCCHFSTLSKFAFPIPCRYFEGFVLFNL